MLFIGKPMGRSMMVWDDAGGGCNVAVPNLPRREVGRAGVYWLALGPSARTSGGRLGTATLLPLLVAEGVLSHTLTFECGTVELESFELSQRRCTKQRKEP